MLVSVFLIAVGVALLVGLSFLIWSCIASEGHPIVDSELEDFGRFLLGVALIVCSAVALPFGIWDQVDTLSSYKEKVYDLISVRRESEVEGSFYIFYGHVDIEDYYKFYYNTDEGIKLGKVETDRSRIIEDDGMDPSVWKIKEMGEDYYYTIYVPSGTVSTTFVLD